MVLGMLVAVVMAAAVIFVVASPSFREGEPMFTPQGEERVDRLVDRASSVAARAESASRDGAQRAKSALAKGQETWTKGQNRARSAMATRGAEASARLTADSVTTVPDPTSSGHDDAPGPESVPTHEGETSSVREPSKPPELSRQGRAPWSANPSRPGLLSRIAGSLEHAGADTSQPRARHSR